MPDLTRTFLDVPLWLWMIGFFVVILVSVAIARTMKFQGVNITLTPPFITFRFDRGAAREQTRQVSENLTGLAPSVNVNTPGGPVQISTGKDARNIQTQGAPYVEYAVISTSSESLPRGSAPPPPRTAHYVQRGEIENNVRAALHARATVGVVGVAGMGGIGKTELAKHLCGELERELDHGVIWLGVYNRTLADLQGELARVLGITFPPNLSDQNRYEILCAAFYDSQRIVFFDDVSRSAIPALKFLIPPSPPCAALITSRQRDLGVATRVFELDVMMEAQSLELVREAHGLANALAREPDAARELCRLCGYLPLALDIAASRLRKQLHFSATPIAALNQSLANRLKELQRGVQPSREDSITVNIGLSYDDLDDADRRRLRALAVFAPSGFAPRGAAAVWGEDEADARASVERLQDGSLVMNAEALGRFRLHDLVRDYAVQKLNECGESDATNRAHAEFLVALFQKHHRVTPENKPFVGEELENLDVAASWAREKNDGELLARLATTPRNWLYNVFRAWDVWYGWLADALRIGKDYAPDLHANVLQAIGDVQQFRDERDAALKSYEQALALFRSVGARLGEANVLQAIGDVQQFRKENDAALKSYEQALALFRSVGDRLGEANVLQMRGKMLIVAGNTQQGLQELENALNVYESIGAISGQANIHFFLGQLLAANNQFDKAIEMVSAAVSLGEKIDRNHPVTRYMREFLEQLRANKPQ